MHWKTLTKVSKYNVNTMKNCKPLCEKEIVYMTFYSIFVYFPNQHF